MLARHYREGEFVRSCNPGPGLHGYLFRGKSGDYLLASWNDDLSAGDSRPVIVTGVTGKASVLDLWGNETPLAVTDGSLVMPVTTRPSTLRIAGQTDMPSVIGEVFRARGGLTVLPGVTREFTIVLTNPGQKNLDFNLAFRTPPGLQLTPDRRTITIPSGETRDAVFRAAIDSRFRPAHREPETVTLDMNIGGLWQGNPVYRVRLGTRIPANNFSAEPSFILNDREQVTALVINEPSTAHLFWKGPEDLGARVWLAKKPGVLKIRAVVTDDIHAQPHQGENVWAGDGIQLGLSIPGQTTFWEIGFTRLASGEPEVFIWQLPRGFSAAKVVEKTVLRTRRDESARQTIYEAEIPLAGIGLKDEVARNGFGFNLLVNDNDNGSTREGFMSLDPGLGRGKTTDNWPVVVSEN
jgi:hypothetical protein